jgi:hypothetical protein
VPTSIDVTKYIVGAAEVYYRATDVLTSWTSVGATLDDVVARVSRTLFNPSDTINSIDEAIAGLDYQRAGQAEFEFTLPEMSGPKLALAIPGAVTTTRTTGVVGGGGSSTTTAATVVGALSVAVAVATNFAVGDYIKIDTTTNTEYRRITAITSLVLSFRDPLLIAHSSGVAVVEVDGDGKTVVTASTVRRQPLTAYLDWALVAQSPADYYEIIIHRGISVTESVEFTFGDETLAGIRVTIGARKSGTDLTLPAWEIYAPAA